MIINEFVRGIELGIAMLDKNKTKIFTNHYKIKNNNLTREIIYEIPSEVICAGIYSFDVAVFIPNATIYDYVHDICDISVFDTGSEMFRHDNYGSVFVKCKWHEDV